jgi:GxxExxY protein
MPALHFRWRCRYRCATKTFYWIVAIESIVSADLIVEVKSVETLLPIHQAQILTYMRLAKVPIGLVINFNVTKLQNGIKRFVL